jgi:hypothetical protein
MRTYIVRKGHHKSRWIPKFWFNKKIFNFSFSIEKGWYSAANEEDTGISKIFGVASSIHAERFIGKIPIIKNLVNSIVIGWYPSLKEGKYDIYIISDNKGIEKRNIVLSCVEGETVKVRIKFNSIHAYVTFNDIYTIPILCKYNRIGYYLFPYFGGKNKAYTDYIVNLTF